MRADVHERLLKLWDENLSAQAIVDSLKHEFGWAPHRNTVYSEVRRHAPPGDSWTLADEEYSPSQAAAILSELVTVLHASNGRRRHFTQREAWWVARLLAVHRSDGFTPLEPGEAFRMARLHVLAEQRGEQLSPWLDAIEPPLAALHVTAGHQETFVPKETNP